MTAYLLPPPKQSFTNGNGLPLVGGTIETYVPGTSTLKDTWRDAEQTTLNSHPILLDARGEAVICGIGAYRFVVKDALGNLIYDQVTFDSNGFSVSGGLDINAANGTFSQNLSVTGASNFIGEIDGDNAVFTGNINIEQTLHVGGKTALSGGLNIGYNPPSLSTSNGDVGDFAYDASYIYVCVAPSTWKRIAISTW